MITKINIGLAISKNYDKISLGFSDEPITHETEEELRAGIRKRFKMLQEEIDLEYRKLVK